MISHLIIIYVFVIDFYFIEVHLIFHFDIKSTLYVKSDFNIPVFVF